MPALGPQHVGTMDVSLLCGLGGQGWDPERVVPGLAPGLRGWAGSVERGECSRRWASGGGRERSGMCTPLCPDTIVGDSWRAPVLPCPIRQAPAPHLTDLRSTCYTCSSTHFTDEETEVRNRRRVAFGHTGGGRARFAPSRVHSTRSLRRVLTPQTWGHGATPDPPVTAGWGQTVRGTSHALVLPASPL